MSIHKAICPAQCMSAPKSIKPDAISADNFGKRRPDRKIKLPCLPCDPLFAVLVLAFISTLVAHPPDLGFSLLET